MSILSSDVEQIAPEALPPCRVYEWCDLDHEDRLIGPGWHRKPVEIEGLRIDFITDAIDGSSASWVDSTDVQVEDPDDLRRVGKAMLSIADQYEAFRKEVD